MNSGEIAFRDTKLGATVGGSKNNGLSVLLSPLTLLVDFGA